MSNISIRRAGVVLGQERRKGSIGVIVVLGGQEWSWDRRVGRVVLE